MMLMQNVENKIAKSDPNNLQRKDFINKHQQSQSSGFKNGSLINISPDSKVLDFLRLLEEYRRKCEEEGNYAEARKARAKFEELLKKETIRQKNNIRAA
jgi:hypothetical protein